MIIPDYEAKIWLERRKDFCDWILKKCEWHVSCAVCGGPAKKGKLELKDIWIKRKVREKEIYAQVVHCSACGGENGRRLYEQSVKFYELHPGYENYPEAQAYDGLNFNPNLNTRDIFLDEGVFEIGEKLPWDKMIRAFWEGIEALMKFRVQFAVFYASGMRTPHIHAYGLFPEVQDWAEKNLSYILFCQKVFPIEIRHLLDMSLAEQQTIALEFASHWRTRQIKKLFFESVPEVKNAVA